MLTSFSEKRKFAAGQVHHLKAVIDLAMVERFAQFSGDENPIHVDLAAARSYGHPKQVAHGAILVSLISRVIGMEIPGPGAVWMSQSIEWLHPVYIGDEVEVTVEVEKFSEGAGLLSIKTSATNQKGTLVMNGKANVKISEKVVSKSPALASGPGRVALVTGASRGIGAAIAKKLAAEGIRVAINFLESMAEAKKLADEITGGGGKADVFQADVRSESEITRMAESIAARLGPVDIVVHGASPRRVSVPADQARYQDVEPLLNAYIGGAMSLVAAAAPGMARNKFGRFIFIGTSALFGAPPVGYAPYLIAKEALWGYVKSLAVELGASGITSNLVSPGLTVTDFTKDVSIRIKEVEARRNPLRRLATVEDTANMVAFLAKEGSEYLNGAHIPLTGGPVS